jgi:hypothetical protein
VEVIRSSGLRGGEFAGTGPDSQHLQIQPGGQTVSVIDLTLFQGLSRPVKLIFLLDKYRPTTII